jgi:hypothetical protein
MWHGNGEQMKKNHNYSSKREWNESACTQINGIYLQSTFHILFLQVRHTFLHQQFHAFIFGFPSHVLVSFIYDTLLSFGVTPKVFSPSATPLVMLHGHINDSVQVDA